MSKLSEIFTYLCEYPHSYSPSIREIGKAVGFHSSSTVHAYLQRLENQGFIKRQPGCPRCISVIRHK
ncbi:LexA family protein [Sporomusa rhizae]|uniref:LexA family protein n=1 Tax=Sporomusa rhizae TaxID=357999 RepID=UPI00352A5335